MIKFFRRIRHRLVVENRFTRYLIYAIGEIFLVVIGILIALQINNWNESQKQHELEQDLLKNLVKTLEQNHEILNSKIKTNQRARYATRLFISIIEDNRPYHDSLSSYFHNALRNTSQIEISRLGYDAIKNAGIEIIQNDSLSQEIIQYFEEAQPYYLRSLSWGQLDNADRARFIDENFYQTYDTLIDRVLYNPFNPETILKKNYMIALFYKTNSQRGYFMEQTEYHLEENKRLLSLVKTHL